MEQDILNLINGQLQAAHGGQWLDNVEPATGQNYSPDHGPLISKPSQQVTVENSQLVRYSIDR